MSFKTTAPCPIHGPIAQHRFAKVLADGNVQAPTEARNARTPMGKTADAWDFANAAMLLAVDETNCPTCVELLKNCGLSIYGMG
jgi:hypothetical protein